MQYEQHVTTANSVQADKHQNASTPNTSLSNVGSFACPNEPRPHSNNQEGFFNSYTLQNEIENPVSPAHSTCSDSVSMIRGDNNKERNPTRKENSSFFASNYQQSHVLPPVWCSQMQSDSSSLATLVSEKKMSDSRRTFCLFVTFDLLLTVILWLIQCGASTNSSHTFFDVVRLQVTDYTMESSLFDVVCLSAARFSFLQITYAALRIRHWWPIAIATAASDVLLILKIFPIFQSTDNTHIAPDIPMTVVLLLTNFVLTWIEVWLMDFKVLPTEFKMANKTVQQFIQSQQQPQSFSFQLHDDASERTPLLSSQPYAPTLSYYTGATSEHASYHSLPVTESDFGSSSGGGDMKRTRSQNLTQDDIVQIERGKSAMNQLWSLFCNKGMWKVSKVTSDGDSVFTTEVPGYGKTFRIDTVVYGVTAQKLLQEIVLKRENMPTWNSTVEFIKILKHIGEQTLISLEVSKPAANGLIKGRDFITVSRLDRIENSYISAGIKTDYMGELPPSDRIKGENGPTGFIIQPCNNGLNACKFTWILNTNLKGSLPQSLVNSNLTSTMITFVSSMKTHLGVE